jgi:hypothetical protein
MVSVEDLKRIVLFDDLTDAMLEQLLPIVSEEQAVQLTVFFL